ncbi:hypothetical protein VTO42DRAFT_2406 [Malbranchea cinnamomea]
MYDTPLLYRLLVHTIVHVLCIPRENGGGRTSPERSRRREMAREPSHAGPPPAVSSDMLILTLRRTGGCAPSSGPVVVSARDAAAPRIDVAATRWSDDE